MMGDFKVSGPIKIRPADLCVTERLSAARHRAGRRRLLDLLPRRRDRHHQGVHRRRTSVQRLHPAMACDRRHGRAKRSRSSTTIPRSWPARRDAWRRPTIFARCRSTTDCHGARSAGRVSWQAGARHPAIGPERHFGRIGRTAARCRADSRGTAGWPEAAQTQPKRRARSLLLVVLILIVVIFIVVLVVIIGVSGRIVRRVALVVPELAVDAVGGEQFRMRAALDRLAA